MTVSNSSRKLHAIATLALAMQLGCGVAASDTEGPLPLASGARDALIRGAARGSSGERGLSAPLGGVLRSIPIHALTAVQEGVLSPSERGDLHELGCAVSIAGDTAIVGARHDGDLGEDAGAAHVFVRSEGVWAQQAKLVAADGDDGDQLGVAVSIAGDTAVVGAHGDADGAGAAYVFVRSAGAWTQQQRLVPADGAPLDRFGASVSISGDTVLVGAHQADDNGNNAGAAYVFVRSGAVWTQQQKLVASDGTLDDVFGADVSVAGDTAIVGAYFDGTAAAHAGSAYVFQRSGGVWTEQQELTASDAAEGDYLGAFVSLSGDTAVVGAIGDADDGTFAGSAYVFHRSSGVFAEQQKLTASDASPYGFFGGAVSISGDVLVIGSPDDGHDAASTGAAYVFQRSASVWTEKAKIRPDHEGGDDQFGFSVAVSGGTAVIGAYLDDGAGNASGSAYAFALRKDAGEPCTDGSGCASGSCTDGTCAP